MTESADKTPNFVARRPFFGAKSDFNWIVAYSAGDGWWRCFPPDKRGRRELLPLRAEVANPNANLPLALRFGTVSVRGLGSLSSQHCSWNAASGQGERGAYSEWNRACDRDRVAGGCRWWWGRGGATIKAILVMIFDFGARNGLI